MADETLALVDLLAKLHGWLQGQPEWQSLLRAPRNVRREASREIGKALYTYPTRTPEWLGRAVRRGNPLNTRRPKYGRR